jgi:hypothetical protein
MSMIQALLNPGGRQRKSGNDFTLVLRPGVEVLAP